MADMRSKLSEIYSLEQLSRQNTVIHRLHPLAKMISTLVYIICIAALGRYDLLSMAPFLFYPVILMALSDVPFGMIGRRTLIALPFSLFAGISNLIWDRQLFMRVGGVVITTGLLSFFTILLRTCLSVAAVLILVAVTPFSQISSQLRRMHVPVIFVSLVEMIYRYIGVLLEEADTMLTAYRLRNPCVKWPLLKDMGSFAGQLFLRSYARAERIYQAMKCRGYGMGELTYGKRPFSLADWVFVLAGCISSVVFLLLA
ncbi:MAG: cobalt ECF transporter T component CbiQ [Clostridium sp.]|nr:cobalt ECF transporter T component CbiQ [Clostridium sp.]